MPITLVVLNPGDREVPSSSSSNPYPSPSPNPNPNPNPNPIPTPNPNPSPNPNPIPNLLQHARAARTLEAWAGAAAASRGVAGRQRVLLAEGAAQHGRRMCSSAWARWVRRWRSASNPNPQSHPHPHT